MRRDARQDAGYQGPGLPAADPEDQEGAVRAAQGGQARGARDRSGLGARLQGLLRVDRQYPGRAQRAGRRLSLRDPARLRSGTMAKMQYRVLGSSGMKVSQLCLGTMMFGGPTDETQARRIVDHALESGVNFIDTANVYTQGQSETVIGPAIKGKRDRWVLATKVAQKTGPDAADSGLSRRHIMQAVEASLKRLQTDHIDLYYIHRVDPSTAWEQTIAAFGDLIRQGKIREWGLSNVRAWHIPHVVHLCRQLGVPQPTA